MLSPRTHPLCQHGVARHRPLALALVAALTACAMAVGVAAAEAQPAGPGPGNSPNAQACQQDSWMNFITSTGHGFANEGECTRYAAQGGTLFTPRSLCEKLVSDAGIIVPADARYVLGTPGDDIFSGRLHPGTDVVCGFGGNDPVGSLGAGAPDYFFGGDGDDVVGAMNSGLFEGGAGNDTVGNMDGGTFEGGDGDDQVGFTMSGGTFNGGAGSDRVNRHCGGTVTNVETVGSC